MRNKHQPGQAHSEYKVERYSRAETRGCQGVQTAAVPQIKAADERHPFVERSSLTTLLEEPQLKASCYPQIAGFGGVNFPWIGVGVAIIRIAGGFTTLLFTALAMVCTTIILLYPVMAAAAQDVYLSSIGLLAYFALAYFRVQSKGGTANAG